MPVLEAKEQTLGKIFSDEYQFLVPDYQRPYSWTDEQTTTLLEDVRRRFGHLQPFSNASRIFRGNLRQFATLLRIKCASGWRGTALLSFTNGNRGSLEPPSGERISVLLHR